MSSPSLNDPSSLGARSLPEIPGLSVPLRRLAAALMLVVGLGSVPATAHAKRTPPEDLPVAEKYDKGLKYLKRGYYVRALEMFNLIRNFHRDDPLAVKAELAIADMHYKKADWAQARLAYEDFMRWHPRNEDLDYVTWRYGMTMYKDASRWSQRDQSWTRAAVDNWSGFGRRFPDSEHREEVEKKLTECRDRLAKKELQVAQFYRQRKAWTAVEGRARGLVTVHADSRHVEDGLALLAEAYAWQGKAAEADKVLGQLAESDPEGAARARARVERAEPDAE